MIQQSSSKHDKEGMSMKSVLCKGTISKLSVPQEDPVRPALPKQLAQVSVDQCYGIGSGREGNIAIATLGSNNRRGKEGLLTIGDSKPPFK